MKLTGWFHPDVSPSITGVYKTKIEFQNGYTSRIGYAYWDGNFWSTQSDDIESAAKNKNFGHRNKFWQGLKVKP